MALGWRVIPNFPLYEINSRGMVKQLRDGRILVTSQNNRGEHYHLESQSGKVVAMKKTQLMSWAFPKETS
jgi:hypothetical protein